MTGAARPGGISRIVVVAAALAAVVAVVAVAATRNEDAATAKAPALEMPTASPERHTGPQGRVGQFVAHCEFSHRAPDDPIVWFEQPGRSHSHEFYGAEEADASSTAAGLLGTPTTCDKPADTAGYWHPTLYDGDAVVPADKLNAYYRAAPGVDPVSVEPFPLGLALIAGDAAATAPQPGEATGWTCGVRSNISDEPPVCPAGAPLHLVLTFQDCWDGKHLEAVDFGSHATYSAGGACPDSHPVHIPQLMVTVKFPIHGRGHDLRLASGNVYSLHGDFLNAWDPDGLAREVEGCIHRNVVCDLVSNREEEPLFNS